MGDAGIVSSNFTPVLQCILNKGTTIVPANTKLPTQVRDFLVPALTLVEAKIQSNLNTYVVQTPQAPPTPTPQNLA